MSHEKRETFLFFLSLFTNVLWVTSQFSKVECILSSSSMWPVGGVSNKWSLDHLESTGYFNPFGSLHNHNHRTVVMPFWNYSHVIQSDSINRCSWVFGQRTDKQFHCQVFSVPLLVQDKRRGVSENVSNNNSPNCNIHIIRITAYKGNRHLWIPTFELAVLSWLFKCQFVNHRLKVIAALSKFHPRGGTRHFRWGKRFTACKTKQDTEMTETGCVFSPIINNTKIYRQTGDFQVPLKRYWLGRRPWQRAPVNIVSQSALRQPPLTSMYTHSPVKMSSSSSVVSQCVYTVSLPSDHW